MKEITKTAEVNDVFWLIKELHPQLELDEFIDKVKFQQKNMNYKLFAFYEEDELIGLCGVMPFFVLYHSRCLYVCDFVISSKKRSLGYGQKCFHMIESYAKEQNYNELELSSSFHREISHEFYEKKIGMDKAGFIFRKKLI